MRRRAGSPEQLPAGLHVYRPQDWPGGRREWHRARLAYAETNPTGPLGDPVDVLAAEAGRLHDGGDR